MPSVYTASKQEQNITKAPSAVTVITAEDIKRMGARSLEDVLKRVVGFYPMTSVDWSVIASRGIAADMNHLYLFLIDGHSVNSINGWGPLNQYVIPLLSNVERIEIIRGPGSTLWGSDAVMATINFITKEGSAVKGLETTVNYSTADNQRSINLLFGNEIEKDVNYTGSFTYFDSEGWKGLKDDDLYNRQYYSTNQAGADVDNWNHWKDSWELYGKMKIKDFTFLARQLHFVFSEPYRNRPSSTKKRDTYLDSTFIEASYLKEIDDTMTMETKVFTDFIVKGRSAYLGQDIDQKYKEIGWGIDSSLSKTIADKHHLQTGVRINITDVGPNTSTTYDTLTGALVSTTTTNYQLTRSGRDRVYGLYFEDQSELTEKLTAIAGVRADYNDFREDTRRFTPRFGLIYAFTDNWTAKYLRNSGYYRPSVAHSMRLPSTTTNSIRNAQKSIETAAQDLQIIYNDVKTTGSVDLFYMTLDNFIANLTGSGTLEGGYSNLGNFETKGIELELSREVLEKLRVYGNYTYAQAALYDWQGTFEQTIMNSWIDDTNHMLQIPRHLYNIGLDWKFKKDCNLNVHMRAWADALQQYDSRGTSNAIIDHWPGEQYFDTTLLMENILNRPVSISLTCTNILDHRGKTPCTVGSVNWMYEQARSYNMRVTYKF